MTTDKPTHSQVEATSNQMEDPQKLDTAGGDIGLKMFDDYGALASPIDEKAEKRLVRKLDMFIIPFICVTYLITYVDKATLSYGAQTPSYAADYTNGLQAAIFGLTKDVHLVGTQYSWLGSIFYFGYLFVGFHSTQ
jgi:hypothetical protein